MIKLRGHAKLANPLLFFVRVITYMFSSHSYIATDVISRHANTVEPLINKDSTVLDQYAILDHLRPRHANSDAWS